MSLFDTGMSVKGGKLDKAMMDLQRKYGMDIVKTGSELISEKRLNIGESRGEARV